MGLNTTQHDHYLDGVNQYSAAEGYDNRWSKADVRTIGDTMSDFLDTQIPAAIAAVKAATPHLALTDLEALRAFIFPALDERTRQIENDETPGQEE